MTTSKGIRPPAPGWLNKIRFITAYIFSDCEAPPALYLEMAQEPAHRTALVFLGFSLTDVVKSFFRPKGLRSKRHGRKGRSYRGRRGGVPEIADLVAERLPGAEEFKGRQYHFGTRALYVFADVADRVAWQLALVEMSTDFVYDTLLGVWTAQRPQCSLNARLLAHAEFIGHNHNPDYTSFPIPGVVWNNFILKPNNFTVSAANGNYICVLGMIVRNIDNAPEQISIALRNSFGPTPQTFESSTITVATGESKYIMVDAFIRNPLTLQWLIKNNGVGVSGMQVVSVDIFIMGVAHAYPA